MGFEKRRRTPPQDADRAAGGVARVLKIADDEGVPVAETPPDILLFSPPPWLVTGPPLGLAAVSAYLKAQGWRVKIIDGNTKAYHDAKPKDQLLWRWEYSAFWEDEAEVEKRFGAMLRRLAEEAAAVGSWAIGVNVVHRKEAAVAIFLRRLKELRPDLRIFVGGPGAGWKESRDHLRELAGDLVDGFVVGEGEVVCDELLRRMRKGESLENLPGFMIAGPDGEAKFKPGRVILDMNKLPVPDFGDFEMEHYDDNSLVVEWNRGCVARCTYCSVNDFWNAFRFKGAKAVAHELKTLHDRHGIEKFVIVDPMVNGNPEHLDAICEAIIESGVKVRWSAGISPNRDVPKSTFVKMAAAGCYQLEFGVDSGSNKILRKMGKRFKADQAGRMMRDAHNAGIDVMLYLIVGFPGETDETVQETIDWLDEYGESIDMVRSINSLTIEDGTAVEQRSELFGVEKDKSDVNWRDNWHESGSSPEMRKARVDRVIDKLKELKIPIEAEIIAEQTAGEDGPTLPDWGGATQSAGPSAGAGTFGCASFPTTGDEG